MLCTSYFCSSEFFFFFFFKQKTAYEMRISDWSSDVCSSDLLDRHPSDGHHRDRHRFFGGFHRRRDRGVMRMGDDLELPAKNTLFLAVTRPALWAGIPIEAAVLLLITSASVLRSEEHTSELQSLMRNSYAVFCLKNKITNTCYDIISTTTTKIK